MDLDKLMLCCTANANDIANASNRVYMEFFGLEPGYLTIPGEACCKVRLHPSRSLSSAGLDR
jgi:hypothetical protein